MTEPIQVYITTDLKEWLRQYADRHGLTMTTVIKILLQRERASDSKNGQAHTLFESSAPTR